MEIIRYVNKAMIYGLKNHRMTLSDFFDCAEDQPQDTGFSQDIYMVRNIPIRIIIPEGDK